MNQKDTVRSAVRIGLSAAEARDRLASDGQNELPRAESRTVFKIVGEVLREPMLALLVGGGILYLVLGDLNEALILLAFAIFSVALTVRSGAGYPVRLDQPSARTIVARR